MQNFFVDLVFAALPELPSSDAYQLSSLVARNCWDRKTLQKRSGHLA